MSSVPPRDPEALDAVIFPSGVPSRRARAERGEPPASPPPGEMAWDDHPQHRFTKYLKDPETGESNPVEVFTVGALAEALGVSTKIIYKWERQRILPPSRYRADPPRYKDSHPQAGALVRILGDETAPGRRFYTRAHIEAVIEAAHEARVPWRPKQPLPDWKLFTALVVRSWKALG